MNTKITTIAISTVLVISAHAQFSSFDNNGLNDRRTTGFGNSSSMNNGNNFGNSSQINGLGNTLNNGFGNSSSSINNGNNFGNSMQNNNLNKPVNGNGSFTPLNDNPLRVWNGTKKDSPSAPHNRVGGDSPLREWNKPTGSELNLTPNERKDYGLPPIKKTN